MTFCFAKAVTFDVNVNVGAASLSNVKSKAKKTLLSPEWYFATDDHGSDKALLRIQQESAAVKDTDAYWSKDGGANWVSSAVDATHKKEYRDYVTSVAKDYALEEEYVRHHYEYKDSIRNQKGGFAAGLDVGVRYELTPCIKIGARAFFTATNLKQDISYSVTPLDKDGNFASETAQNEREVQMLIGYGDAHGNDQALGATQYLYGDALKIVKDNGDEKSLVLANEKTAAADGASAMAFYALNINKTGQQILSKATKNGDKYEVTLDAVTYGSTKGIVLTKTGVARADALVGASEVQKAVCALYRNDNNNAAASEKLRARNYALKTSDLTVTATAIAAGETVLEDSNFTTMAANITGNRAADAENAGALGLTAGIAAANSKAYYIADGNADGQIATTDKLVISEEKYNEIMQAFEEMSADFDRTVIDQTLKVKNVWGGMVTLSWNATDCTLFTLGLGVGVPSVSKIDNLKKKVGFAGMFEVSTKIADSFSVGLRYQYNRINLKEKDCDSAVHHLSKVNGNLHVFSANFTYAF